MVSENPVATLRTPEWARAALTEHHLTILMVRSTNGGRFDPIRHGSLLDAADRCIDALPADERQAASALLARHTTERTLPMRCRTCATVLLDTLAACKCAA